VVAERRTHIGFRVRDTENALKRFLTDQFVKFFLLIGPSKQRDFDTASM